ncbi:flippase [Vibrio breoganii]
MKILNSIGLDGAIIKNISALFSIRVSNYVIPLITLPYLVRVLEPTGFGILSLIIAVNQYFILIVSYGFDLSATQKVARKQQDLETISKTFWDVLFCRILLLILCFSVFIVVLNVSESFFLDTKTALSGFLTVIGTAFYQQWIFQGKEKLGMVSLLRVITQLVSVPLLLFYVNSPSDIWIAVLISSFPTCIVAIFSNVLIWKRKWIIYNKPTIEGLKNELMDGWHLFISTISTTLYTTTITVALGIVSGPVAVAAYASANKLIVAAKNLATPISSSFYPRINRLHTENRIQAKKLTVKLFKIQSFLMLTIGILIFVFSEEIVSLLFGLNYTDTVPVLRIMAFIPVLVSISNVLGVHVLIIHGFKKEFSKVIVLTGIIGLLLIFPLCYQFGVYGAAFTALAAELIVAILMLSKVFKYTNFIERDINEKI